MVFYLSRIALLLRTALAIRGLLCFHMYFRIILSVLVKNVIEIFYCWSGCGYVIAFLIGTAMNL
jgi:hypothetical protein